MTRTRQGRFELGGDDRGVAGRAAEFGDDADDVIEVQGGGVCRRQVVRDDDRRLGQRGDAGFGHAEHLGDDPVPDVPQVGDPLGQVGPARLEDLAEALDGLVDGGGRTGAGLDPADHVGQQAGVLRHQRGRFQNRGGGRLGGGSPDPQIRRDVLEGAADQGLGRGFVRGGRFVGRRPGGQRRV